MREPGPGEVLIRTLYSGISAGTEMNVYRGFAPQLRTRRDPTTRLFTPSDQPEWSYPLAYGYAAVGRIEQVGENVDGLAEGDHVAAYTPHQAYATTAVKASDGRPLVNSLGAARSVRHGVFVPNLNTALNAMLDARPVLGDVVVVMGLGVIGQLIAQLARRAGPGLVVTVDGVAHRRDLSVRLGADVALEPGPSVAQAVRDLSGGRGADVVFEVSGAPTALNEAIRTAGFNGLVVAVSWYGGTFESLSLSGEFHHNRVRIHSSQVGVVNPQLGPLWSVARRSEVAVRLLRDLELDPLLTHEFPIERAADAYRTVDSQVDGLVQCVLAYPTS